MIVCSCNVLSDGQVRECLNAGPQCPRTAAQVYQCLGCSPKCGRCARTIRAIVAAALGEPAAHVCATACATTCPLGRTGDAQEIGHHAIGHHEIGHHQAGHRHVYAEAPHVHAEAPSDAALAVA